MELALQIFFGICCLVMILVVLMQRSEGDGVAGMLGGGQGEAIFGTKTVNILARFTAALGVLLLVLIVVLGKMGSSNKSLMDDMPAPAAPVQAEATQEPVDPLVQDEVVAPDVVAPKASTDEKALPATLPEVAPLQDPEPTL